MQYRRRLRSRIIISFALFGLGLTALFAVATIYVRARLEDQFINSTLAREVQSFADFKRENPSPDAPWQLSLYQARIFSARRFSNVPLAWQKFDSGVYNLSDYDDKGHLRPYKLAVSKSDDLWAFLQPDDSAQKLSERLLLLALIATVIIFTFWWTWNSFLEPFIFLSSPDLFPVSVGLNFFNDQYGTIFYDRLIAASVMRMVPMIVLFFFAQRYFIEGIQLTGLKG